MNNLLEYKLDLIAEQLGVYKIETIAAVMRRQHINPSDGQTVDVIDFYPEWNELGTYGRLKVAHEYMDQDWQRQRFEKYSGITIDSIPLYEGQQALQRKFDRKHPGETAVTPFKLMVQPRKDDNGNNEKTLVLRYLYDRRGNGRSPVAVPASPPPHVNGNGHHKPPSQPEPVPAANGPVEQSVRTRTTNSVTIEKDWELEAAEAQNDLMFDTALAKAVPWFKNSDTVRQFREIIWDGFNPDHSRAYVRGLQAYARERQKANGSREAHNRAKTLAVEAFRAELSPTETAAGYTGYVQVR